MYEKTLNNMSQIQIDLQLPTGPVAQWIRNLTTNQGIPGSSPGRVNILLHIVVWIISLNNMSDIRLDLQLPTGLWPN